MTPLPVAAPPGLSHCASKHNSQASFNGHRAKVTDDEVTRVADEVRHAILKEIDAEVHERLHSVWRQGAKEAKQLQLENEHSTDQLLQSVALFKAAQENLEAENQNLRQLLLNLSEHLSQLSTSSCKLSDPWSCCPAASPSHTPSTCATPSGSVCDFGSIPSASVLARAFSGSSVAGTPAGVLTPSSDCGFPQTPSNVELSSFLEAPPGLSFGQVNASPRLVGAPKIIGAPLSLADALGFSSPKKVSCPETPSRAPPVSPPRHAAPLETDFSESVDAFIFGLTLRVADAANLGICTSAAGPVLRIDSIQAGSAADAWNRQCSSSGAAERVLCIGDQIVGVNDVYGDAQAMAAECKRTKLLRLQIVRSCTQKPATSAPSAPPATRSLPSTSPPPTPPPAAPPAFTPSIQLSNALPPPPTTPADGACSVRPVDVGMHTTYATPAQSQSALFGPPSSPPPLGLPPPLPLFRTTSAAMPPPSCPPGRPGTQIPIGLHSLLGLA
jgi:hypothetical protein